MEVNNSTNTAYTATTTSTAQTSNSAASSQAPAASTTTSTESAPAAVYESNKSESKLDTAAKLKAAMDETNRRAEDFREMIKKLISNQAKKNATANGNVGEQAHSDAFNDLMGKIYNGESVMVEIDAETRAAAQKEIGEGGYYSVEKTGDRILDFADAFAGTDPAKLKVMQDAFEKGYNQAAEMWGDALPQISKDTYDYVMKGFADRMNATPSAE